MALDDGARRLPFDGTGHAARDGSTANEESGCERPASTPTRRRVLRAGAIAAGGIAGASGPARAQAERFELVGTADGWEGRAPSGIDGETNPTLPVEPGATYVIEWENGDGLPHNVAIEDADGQDVLATDVVQGSGVTQALEFEATEAMDAYYCEVHPGSMRGSIAADGEVGIDADARFFAEGPTVGLAEVASGLTAPTDLAAADDGRLFVADRTGELWLATEPGVDFSLFEGGLDGGSLALDLGDRLVERGEFAGRYADSGEAVDERGLLGVALHPAFEETGRLYVHYSAPPSDATPSGWSHRQVVSEFEVDGDGTVDPDAERVLLTVQTPQYDHDGGPIAFGPDGYLYVPTGDGGGETDAAYGHVEDWYDDNAGGNGQDTVENGLGGLHRIDVDGRGTIRGHERPYDVPEDNPLVGQDDQLVEYFAWGFRNPAGVGFDADGRPIVADVGGALAHEVNRVEAGGNYGWNVREGSRCFEVSAPDEPAADCPDETPDHVRDGGEVLQDPVVEYRLDVEDEPVGSAVVGGHVYDGDALPALEGQYVFGERARADTDHPRDGRLFAAEPTDDGDWAAVELAVEGGDDDRLHRFVRQFGRGPGGECYVLTDERAEPEGETGAVHRLVPPGEGEDFLAPGSG